MEIVIFFVFVAACALALLWASRKTQAETDLARRKRAHRNRARSSKFTASDETLMTRKEEVWNSRHHHAALGVQKVNRFAPKSESGGVPEYDGYSRRDRHHVRDRNARVREDSATEKQFTMTAIHYRTDDDEEAAAPAKTAS
ncbi:MAG: hypothetical protein P8Y54_10215 [Xanthomonadales bacterium]